MEENKKPVYCDYGEHPYTGDPLNNRCEATLCDTGQGELICGASVGDPVHDGYPVEVMSLTIEGLHVSQSLYKLLIDAEIGDVVILKRSRGR